jgi:glyoxylate/hydroxypyruvate reductase A
MNRQIAFIGKMASKDQDAWLAAIRPLLVDAAIIPYEEISPEQRMNIEVAIVANPDPKDLATLPALRWVQSLWAGVERLVVELPKVNFDIVRMIDPNLASTMAEAVLAWTYYLHRDMPKYLFQQKHKIWQQGDLRELKDRNIGILGLGQLGRAAVEKLLLNGFNVSGWSRRLSNMEGVKCFAGMDQLADILAKSDILICLLPLTAETNGLLNDERLRLLPTGASIINFSRGQIIDQDALLRHLENAHLDHAVLDVFETEPLPMTSALWDSPKITVLPHISAPTNTRTASDIVARNLMTYFETGKIPESISRPRGY